MNFASQFRSLIPGHDITGSTGPALFKIISSFRALALALALVPAIAQSSEPASRPSLPPYSACAPKVEIFHPEQVLLEAVRDRSTLQAALFLSRVGEDELKLATSNLESGTTLYARAHFEGSDTRWRLSPTIRERETPHQADVLADVHDYYLVAQGPERAMGTLVVVGYPAGSGRIFDPLILAHLADGRAISVKATRTQVGCTLGLQEIETLFLDALATHFALNE